MWIYQAMIQYDGIPYSLRFLVGDVINRSVLRVATDRIELVLGRIEMTVPRSLVLSAVELPPRGWPRVGWRKNKVRTLSLVASRNPIVRISLDPPGSVRLFGLTLGVDRIDVALEDAIGLMMQMQQWERVRQLIR